MRIYLRNYEHLLDKARVCFNMTPKEEEFIADLRERYDEYGNGTYITQKQLDWLQSIVEKG